MIAIEDIIRSIKEKKFGVTDHADEEASNDGISLREAFETIANGQIIEQYPDDKPFPKLSPF